MTSAWILLLAGVACEIFATTCLRLSEGFSRLMPSAGFAVGFAAAFYIFSLAIREMDIGIAYAVWAGLGITGIALVGIALFGEEVSATKFFAIGLIVAGSILLNLTTQSG